MQHSQDFKRRGVNFTVDGRRLRAHYKAIDRKSWRDDVMMKRRSSSSQVFHNDIPEDDISFKKLTPLKEKNEEVELQTAKIRTDVKKPVKKLTAADERRQQLIKYKERKQLLKELERKNKPSKPVFKVCQVKHGYDPFANVASTKSKMVKPLNTEHKRVTRSTAKSSVAIEKPKEVALKVKPNLKPKVKSVAAKKTNQKLKTVEPIAKQVKRVSFAPEGFQFTAPVDLKFPSPRKRPTSDKNAYVFPNNVLKSSLKAKESDNDEIELKKTEVSSIIAVTSNDRSNEKELGDSNIPETSKNFVIESEINTESENDKLQMDEEEVNDNLTSDSENDKLHMEEEEQSENWMTESNSNTESESKNLLLEVRKTDENLNTESKAVEFENKTEKAEVEFPVSTPNVVGFDVMNYYSPFVTTPRGSSSKKRRRARTSQVKRLSDNYSFYEETELLNEESKRKCREESSENSAIEGNETKSSLSNSAEISTSQNEVQSSSKSNSEEISLSSQNEISPSEIGGVATFKKLVFEYTEMFKWKIRTWNLVKDEDGLPEFVVNEIDSAVGMAELLMTQRFKQFEDLIADCEFNRSEKEVTCEDLLGFWDMIYQQVKNIEFQFDKLSKMKENNWTSTTPKPKKKKRRVKRLTPKPKLKGKSSHLREHIAAARKLKKTEEFKSEDTAITNTPLSTLNSSKSVLSSPVTDRSAQKERRVTRSSSRREGSLSYLLMPTPARDDDVYFSAENDENLAETFVQSSSGETHVLDAPSIANKKKLRRSVRFALNTKADKNDDTSAYRTTPFTRRQKSRIKSSSSSSPTEESTSYLSESISDYKSFSDECSHSRCTPAMEELSLKSSSVKKKKRVSLLPLGNLINITPGDGDLISFSPAFSKAR